MTMSETEIIDISSYHTDAVSDTPRFFDRLPATITLTEPIETESEFWEFIHALESQRFDLMNRKIIRRKNGVHATYNLTDNHRDAVCSVKLVEDTIEVVTKTDSGIGTVVRLYCAIMEEWDPHAELHFEGWEMGGSNEQ